MYTDKPRSAMVNTWKPHAVRLVEAMEVVYEC